MRMHVLLGGGGGGGADGTANAAGNLAGSRGGFETSEDGRRKVCVCVCACQRIGDCKAKVGLAEDYSEARPQTSRRGFELPGWWCAC